ncbi:hypothetical protein CVT24_013278, partial [Panaeolus cyanescens]
MPGRLSVDPEARHAQEELINAYEAEEERIINVLSRKLEKLREDKIDLENALEAESENHVMKLSRQLGAMRMENEELKAKYEALLADKEGEEGGSSSSAGRSSNGIEPRHRRRKRGFLTGSGSERKKKRSVGKSKDTGSSNSTSTSNGKSKTNSKGKEKARSSSRSPPRPEAMSRSSTLTALNTLLSGGLSVAEPSADMMLSAMKRENEHLRNRLVDTEREYIRMSRLNEIYREELIAHRRRLGLAVDNLIGISADPLSQPTHHRSHSSSNHNMYHSNMSSPSTSMYHIPTMNGLRHYDTLEHMGTNGHNLNGHGPSHHLSSAGPHTSSSSSKQASSSRSHSTAAQGVPIPRPTGEDPYALGLSAHAVTRRHRPKNVISSEGSTPLSRSPTSDDDIDSDDDDVDQDFFSPGASGSASGAGSISPYPLFSPINSSHMAQYAYGRQSGRMRSTSGAGLGDYASAHGGYGYSNPNSHSSSYNNQYQAGAQPASYASVDTSATSPPSSGGGLGFGGGGGFAGMLGMRGIGVPSLGAMAANASHHGHAGGLGRGGNTPLQRGLSYPSVPPPSLSSSLGSISPSVPLYTHFRDRDRDREWAEGSREPSLSPVEPLSRRNSFGGPGGRRGSVGAGGRVAETGSLRSAGGSRRASFDYSYSSFGGGGGPSVPSSASGLGLIGVPLSSSAANAGSGSGLGGGGSGVGGNVTVLASGARVAETGSLLRSGSGRSRAGSLTMGGGGGYSA